MSTLGEAESERSEADDVPAEESVHSNTVSAKSHLLTGLQQASMFTLTLFSMQMVFRWNQIAQKSLRSKLRVKPSEQPARQTKAKPTEHQNQLDKPNNIVSPVTTKNTQL